MKTTITKKLLILLISGMFSFSVAEAQSICDCTNGQPGYCYVDNNGNIRCARYHPHASNHGGFRTAGNGMVTTSSETSLTGIIPNPVSSSATISFSLSGSQNVSLRVFDMNGRLVTTLADVSFEEGYHEIVWNAADVHVGIYFLQLQSEENLETVKLIVTK